jgi:hypothetical protein
MGIIQQKRPQSFALRPVFMFSTFDGHDRPVLSEQADGCGPAFDASVHLLAPASDEEVAVP